VSDDSGNGMSLFLGELRKVERRVETPRFLHRSEPATADCVTDGLACGQPRTWLRRSAPTLRAFRSSVNARLGRRTSAEGKSTRPG
jgi:hypothetical protein